ncbi:MAG: Rne/Rng family ribonuclease [Gammaproteobacteria bacterium]|nr:Rne/Rng family ribonuclease [Gammaproteobacteria bacterium]
MAEEILINVTMREMRVAFLKDGILQDIHIERNLQQSIVSNIYKGKVSRLLPGIQAAFVDIGLERAAFLHIKDIAHSIDNADIRDLLHPGQDLLVQVYKDPLGTKGARLTTQFSIPSRYLVFTPTIQLVTVSQKITDENERERLIDMVPQEDKGGYIFRTAAIGALQSHIDSDRAFLHKMWKEIITHSKQAKTKEIVYREMPLILRLLRDLDKYSVERIRVDDITVMQQMAEFVACYLPELNLSIEYCDSTRPIFDIYDIETQLQKALQRKIHLKSGGHVIFDQTEAMTTIDVNTGSYLGKGLNNEETIYSTNLEAVDVIARQVKLRNLGGIIIIDFIDMVNPDYKTQLIELLNKAMAADHVRTEISELSSLGLVQMTRKRTRESLEHILCVSCPLCHRRGSLKSLKTVCYDIFREIKRVAFTFPVWSGFLIIAAENVINYMTNEEMGMLKELETHLNKPLAWRIEKSFGQEQYNILPLEKE